MQSNGEGLRSRRTAPQKNAGLLGGPDHYDPPDEPSRKRAGGLFSHAPRSHLLHPVFLLVILVFYVLDVWLVLHIDSTLPEPLPVNDATLKSGRFLEERARRHLVQLSAIGPKPTGSYENEVLAVEYIRREIQAIQQITLPNHKLSLDLQVVSGDFELNFLRVSYISSYANIQNIVAKLEPADKKVKDAILINCHFDSAIGSPGASDDIVSCSNMLEVLRLLSQTPEDLNFAYLFLFNGAEENFLQAAHGFITQHRWAPMVRAVVNLEACGSGGRDIIFQAGPDHPWLVEAYAKYAPHPFATVVAQDIFRSGMLPMDTDYRIFRDFGNIPGLDIAYVKNGYIYHTKDDRPEFITPGSLQRAGDNLLGLLRGLRNSPYVSDPGEYKHGNLVFFDVFGLFIVRYPMEVGVIIHSLGILLVLAFIFYDLKHAQRISGLSPLAFASQFVRALLVIALSAIAAMLWSMLTGVFLDLCGRSLSWYGSPPLLIPLYILPTLLCLSLCLHAGAAFHPKKLQAPSLLLSLYLSAVRVVFALVMASALFFGLSSAFLLMMFLFFPTLADVISHFIFPPVVPRTRTGGRVISVLVGMMFPGSLALITILYGFHVFIPVAGRFGNARNPELVLGAIVTFSSVILMSYTACLTLVIRGRRLLWGSLGAIYAGTVLLVLFTPLGFPYRYTDPANPRLQRVIIQHVERRFHNRHGHLVRSDAGFWSWDLDRQSPSSYLSSIPGHESARAITGADCARNLTCGMPYYYPAFGSIRETTWIPAPHPRIRHRNQVKISKERISGDVWRVNVKVVGPDHMTAVFAIGPEMNRVIRWSFKSAIGHCSVALDDREAYFLWHSYGVKPEPWTFWIEVQSKQSTEGLSEEALPRLLDLAISGHSIHGEDMVSDEVKGFRSKLPPWTGLIASTSTYDSFEV